MEAQNGGGGAKVVLNVYDLTPMNKYLYWFGLGIFHSGIEVHGMEYGFGAHEFPTSGVFEVEPKSCPGFVYRRSVWMGTTEMSRAEFCSFIENLTGKYNGNTYHLVSKNCNHFTDDVCKNLTRKAIPRWVNRLARAGSFFNCLLPKSIQVSTVRHVPTHPAFSDPRATRRLRRGYRWAVAWRRGCSPRQRAGAVRDQSRGHAGTEGEDSR